MAKSGKGDGAGLDLTLRGLLESTLLRRAFRFGISGLCVTAFHAMIAAGLIEFAGSTPALGNGIAFVLANLMSYLLHTYWSFSHQPGPRSLVRFICVSLMGLGLTVAIASVVDFLGFPYWVGIACVVIGIPPFTFLMHNFWTYRR